MGPVHADGPRRGRPIRSPRKRQRQQRSLAVGLVLSLLGFACVNRAVVDRDASSGDPSSGTSAADADTSSDADQGTDSPDGGGDDQGPDEPGPRGDAGLASAAEGPRANDPGYDGWVDPTSSGQPWSSEVEGLITFRGNPTRSYYGQGPVPSAPEVLWSVPEDGGFCGESAVGGSSKTWCGTGWTGQPSVWEGPDDKTWVAFGAYDKAIHILDAETGADLRQPFVTGDIIKGSVTIDPDGFPLLYSGSRDNKYHVLAFDRGEAMEELWTLDAEAVSPTLWNDDWDSSGLVIDDYLFEGGENSQIHIVKLNRAVGADGKVTVAPELVWNAPGWDDELLSELAVAGTRSQDVSIENSVAISGDTLYFANSGGLVQGWDISGLKDGVDPTRTFRFWTGDDIDASIVVDDEGFLYVGSEYERGFDRSLEVGQLIKLDPRRPDDPLVWSVDDHESSPGGIWATPAIHGDVVYVPTNGGRLLGVDRGDGEVLWTIHLPGPTWQSPVVVDDVLIQGDCNGVLHGYDVSDPRVAPPELWTVQLEGCIESTPAVWGGRIFVGARGGKVYALGDA